ncbi:PEP-CTERM sorting domain-containing protein [Pontiella sulfatireligans]|uniref:Ice-binding protein C-terminal domain-containing protein n=1 Tax=Pontiella sulfatireligans TaxID=2750658 RepID=A0A6C2UM85_9BACT|nr:PEP-CTERM sorting domain-containing protein [Pontiella sulfatireligans]VGO21238.1 hypothetical protein SCARR_03310 [Pontiella sulfatireligans]
MKKLILMFMGGAVALSSNGGLVYWSSTNWGQEHSILPFQTLAGTTFYTPMQSGWFVGLYNANVTGGLDIDLSDLNAGLIEQTTTKVVTVPAFASTWGINGKSIDIADNIPIFTVIFDNSTHWAASFYTIVDSAPFNSGSVAPPAIGMSYSLQAPAGSIPEPSTVGLMGIAGISMFLARKRRHN